MLKVMCLHDACVGAYHKPFYAASVESAKRGFKQAANDAQSEIFKYPESYHLFELGDYDETTAKFFLLDAPRSHGCAIEYVSLAS